MTRIPLGPNKRSSSGSALLLRFVLLPLLLVGTHFFFIISYSGCGTKKTDTLAPSTSPTPEEGDGSSNGDGASESPTPDPLAAEYASATEADSSSSFVAAALAQAVNSSYGASLYMASLPGSSCQNFTASIDNQTLNGVRLRQTIFPYEGGQGQWSGLLQILSDGPQFTCESTTPFDQATAFMKQFIDSNTGLPATATRTSTSGTTLTLDHGTANLSNFNGDTLTPLANGGYGQKILLSGGGRILTITIQERWTTLLLDYTLDGTVTLAANPDSATATRNLGSGTFTTYLNRFRIIGTVKATNVSFTPEKPCPCAGTFTTTFTPGSNSGAPPTTIGTIFLGKTESLSLLGCGFGTFTDILGNQKKVKLSQCL